MPTKNKPFLMSIGEIALQISKSLSLRTVGWAVPPAAMLLFMLSSLGFLAKAPIGSPSTKITRLSPNLISGINSCTMKGVL